MASLAVGDSFDSFAQVEAAVKSHEEVEGITYWRRHSRTLKAGQCRKKGLENANPELVYFEIQYTCLKGGREFASSSKGQRPNQSTFRESCKAAVWFRASNDGQKLVVVKITDHNHEINKEGFPYLPKQRRLNDQEREEVDTLLSVRPNKKILQDHIRKNMGKMVSLRDISNQQSKLQDKVSDLSDALSSISSSEGKTVRILSSEGMLEAIYYQDNTMKKKFMAYPEVLMVDATYKLNDLRMPVFLQLVIDGNGESEIVSVYVVVTESAETISSLTEMFKEENPAWTKTKTIMTDKDFMERNVFGTCFPEAQLQLCLFHVLRTMKREINTQKMGISVDQRDHCLELLQKLAYSTSESVYAQNYQNLEQTGIRPVVDYVSKQWHPIRKEWVVGLKESCHFNNHTNNRLESINQKLKQVIQKFSNLRTFFEDLETVIRCLRQERDCRLANVFLKRPSIPFPPLSVEARYAQALTPHAFSVVLKEIEKSRRMTIPDYEGESVTMVSSCGIIVVDPTSCTCNFTTINQLPCRHVFSLREKIGLDMFFEDSVAKRWTMDFYRDASIHTFIGTSRPVMVLDMKKEAPKTQAQKYKRALTVVQSIATYASEVSTERFQLRMKVLEQLADLWADDKEAAVVEVIEQEAGVQEMEGGGSEVCDLQLNEIVQSGRAISGMNDDITEELIDIATDGGRGISEINDDTTTEVIDMGTVDKGSIQLKECEVRNGHLTQESRCSPSSEPSDNDFAAVKLPPRLKVRGKPKGIYQTAIGLSKKRVSSKPVPFWKKTPVEKDRCMLRWFVEGYNVESALSGTLLTSKDLKPYRDISTAAVDENIDIHRIKKYFVEGGWKHMLVSLKKKKKTSLFCSICQKDLDADQVGCDSCLDWFHFACVGLHAAPKSKRWFCTVCFSNV